MMESTEITKRGRTVRALLRNATTASLASSMSTNVHAYASLVLMATDQQGLPLLLLSDLAVHSRNIVKNPNVSLLVSEAPENRDPLTLPRISVEGSLERVESAALKERYLRRYPSARDFMSFADFKLYQMTVSRAHLVAGFGDIHWLDKDEFLLNTGFLDNIDVETEIIDHMNSDHADAVQELISASTDKKGGNWELCGIDVEGMNFRKNWQHERILFNAPVSNANDVRAALIAMLNNVRN